MAQARKRETVGEKPRAPDRRDAIRKVQRLSAAAFNELPPSQVHEVFWLFAERQAPGYPRPTPRSGKWLLFIRNEEIDEWWAKVRRATEAGELGGSAKVATMKPNPNAADSGKRVICVYTYDCGDLEDVRRVRAKLRDLGVTWKVPYKKDDATMAGKYVVRGHTRVSLLYE